MRIGNFVKAEEMVVQAIKTYSGKGRLWSLLIQLEHKRAKSKNDFDHTHETFMKAINEISKSGEVWCEGARLCMTNNLSNSFYSLKNALQYLKFAILFTPQYGDSFIELIRICLTIKKCLKERTLSIDEE